MAASPSAKASSITATAGSGAVRASRTRASWPNLAATAALEAPMTAAGSQGARRVRANRPAARAPRASRLAIPGGTSRLGVDGSLSMTSSPPAPATTSRLVHGRCRNGGRDGSWRPTRIAKPIWERRPDAAPRSTLPSSVDSMRSGSGITRPGETRLRWPAPATGATLSLSPRILVTSCRIGRGAAGRTREPSLGR